MLAFKIMNDPFVGSLTFCRIYSGKVESGGIVPLALGNPIAPSVMQAMLLRVWLRPVSRHERVGEQSAVVCHCV